MVGHLSLCFVRGISTFVSVATLGCIIATAGSKINTTDYCNFPKILTSESDNIGCTRLTAIEKEVSKRDMQNISSIYLNTNPHDF